MSRANCWSTVMNVLRVLMRYRLLRSDKCWPNMPSRVERDCAIVNCTKRVLSYPVQQLTHFIAVDASLDIISQVFSSKVVQGNTKPAMANMPWCKFNSILEPLQCKLQRRPSFSLFVCLPASSIKGGCYWGHILFNDSPMTKCLTWATQGFRLEKCSRVSVRYSSETSQGAGNLSI